MGWDLSEVECTDGDVIAPDVTLKAVSLEFAAESGFPLNPTPTHIHVCGRKTLAPKLIHSNTQLLVH